MWKKLYLGTWVLYSLEKVNRRRLKGNVSSLMQTKAFLLLSIMIHNRIYLKKNCTSYSGGFCVWVLTKQRRALSRSTRRDGALFGRHDRLAWLIFSRKRGHTVAGRPWIAFTLCTWLCFYYTGLHVCFIWGKKVHIRKQKEKPGHETRDLSEIVSTIRLMPHSSIIHLDRHALTTKPSMRQMCDDVGLHSKNICICQSTSVSDTFIHMSNQ